MKQLLNPILLSVLLASSGLRLNAQGNYPLDVGNRWDYWVIVTTLPPVPAYAARAVRDTAINGRLYTMLEGGDTAWWSPQFLRQEGSVVREYRSDPGREFVLCDFSASVGDTVDIRHYPSGDSSNVILMSAGYSIIFGRSLYTQRYREVFSSMPWFPNSWEVVDSIGLYRMGIGGDPPSVADVFFFLVGAFIRGITIGTLDVDPIANTTPQQFVLEQNYPNPFNPGTTIRFTIPESRFTSLKVYNLLGAEVATLVNEQLAPGTYERTFDAVGLASGIYFYTLQTGEFVQTRKLVLLK